MSACTLVSSFTRGAGALPDIKMPYERVQEFFLSTFTKIENEKMRLHFPFLFWCRKSSSYLQNRGSEISLCWANILKISKFRATASFGKFEAFSFHARGRHCSIHRVARAPNTLYPPRKQLPDASWLWEERCVKNHPVLPALSVYLAVLLTASAVFYCL